MTAQSSTLILELSVQTDDFDYFLPAELIAQVPAPERDQSRLLVLDRHTGTIVHKHFGDLLEFLRAGDLLVLNNSKVIPARLHGVKTGTGAAIEVFLLEEVQANDWWVMLRPGKRSRPGTTISLRDIRGQPTTIQATVTAKSVAGHYRLTFWDAITGSVGPSTVSAAGTFNLKDCLEGFGEIPLPPYIDRAPNTGAINDNERYQTVYARAPGSVAAPTAGLHFTSTLLDQARANGVEVCFVALHVGPGTFAPVKTQKLEEHPMHAERFQLSAEVAATVDAAKRDGRRIIAVGTTTVRVLESVAQKNQGRLNGTDGCTNLFIYPPYHFRLVDGLLSNFHLPKSTLLMLVSAFAAPGEERGRALVLEAYAEAIRRRYRFFSYGDAMLLI